MIEKRINLTMIIMSLIGGVIGFILGEILLNSLRYIMSSIILMGLYFGILAFCIGTMCLIGEMISPRLNGDGWKNNYLKTSFKLLIPCTLIGLFVFGAMFQFLYEISAQKFKKADDIVFAIDTSGSMKNTDPNNERFSAALNLIDNMDKNNRFSMYKFDDTAEKIIPMSQVTKQSREEVSGKLKDMQNPKGNTNMRDALEKAYEEIKSSETKDKNAMVIMLSDGGDTYDLSKKFDETLKPFKEKNISIYTIGMSNGNNFSMLKEIAKESGGNYYNVKEIKDLKNVFNKIYRDRQQRLLVDKRYGIYEASSLYKFLRVMFITFLGALIALSVSLVFDNKNLLKGFLVGGILSGFAAGIIMEAGFLYVPWMGMLHRCIADIVIAVIFTIIPVKVDVKDYSKKSSYMDKIKNFNIYENDSSNNMFQ
ncbi:von Willebrand factor A [Clostridium carboxidivorans P7]|uniref:von Willebrand factor type A n=1 Tax=Clostridium carboxidivorans P7 TaxID=536227 RepID=C6PWL8_9CLOT|nr:vWA domain-containing protein [Clostridium carboxidivorans]AKN30799.1 von Willebrand factor A [Clostridium carboxidivorans P7]EET86371.1 von Willebrand factor type A [Clostridium carboxidivorans P7]EFG88493.1 von Willebrand factor type A domain protein [Clostridium carboxidivorans P7]